VTAGVLPELPGRDEGVGTAPAEVSGSVPPKPGGNDSSGTVSTGTESTDSTGTDESIGLLSGIVVSTGVSSTSIGVGSSTGVGSSSDVGMSMPTTSRTDDTAS
jgi:hypothetical protein